MEKLGNETLKYLYPGNIDLKYSCHGKIRTIHLSENDEIVGELDLKFS